MKFNYDVAVREGRGEMLAVSSPALLECGERSDGVMVSCVWSAHDDHITPTLLAPNCSQ